MSSPKQSDEDSSASGDMQEFDFSRKSIYADIQLEVEGKPLYVSRSFLATISPVFRQMFESDFKEKNVDVLPLPGKKYEDVLTFLRCTNQGVSVKVDYDNVYGVFPLAHEYQAQRLLEECTNCLLKELRSVPITDFDKNCRDMNTTLKVLRYCEICVLAENYDLEDLLKICVKNFTKINAKWYKNAPMFQKISTNLRNRIFCGRLDTTECAVRIQEKRATYPSYPLSFGSIAVPLVKPQKASNNGEDTESEEDCSDEEDIPEFEFLIKSSWSDIQLEIEGKPLYVARSFLATISPVFRQMFESDFKEKNVDVLPLPGKKYKDVLTFLRCTSQGVLEKVNSELCTKIVRK
ncbi:hypothetical protein CHS0354_021526 [Potamilus streckersoni]|uniref:BTB domain-containing protein n=1 Tax=Potamilus streckersoni TaxID=2493646 RepID=A0AAE0SNP8_9BIVA|nr:hypothetical protein CHS0354_021526 [Potamilus streckersoni]